MQAKQKPSWQREEHVQIPKMEKRNHKEKFIDGSERTEWQDHSEKSCQREHQPRPCRSWPRVWFLF